MKIVSWNLFLMKKLLNKEVYGSRNQYTKPIKQCHSNENLDCQRGGGTRAPCMGPTDKHSNMKCAR